MDKFLFDMAHKIADISYEYYALKHDENKCLLFDNRHSQVNPYFYQTEQGLFLEIYYGILGGICTPLGLYKCWNGGMGTLKQQEDSMTGFLSRLEIEVHAPMTIDSLGDEYGPVYKILSVDGISLPYPTSKNRSQFIEYYTAIKKWEELK